MFDLLCLSGFVLIWTCIRLSVLDKQRMAYKLEKFGVSAECILIQCNKAVCCSFAFKEHICFYLFSCAIVVKTAVVVCVNFLQWSVDLSLIHI